MSKPRNARRAQEREQLKIQKALGILYRYPYPEAEIITLMNPGTDIHGMDVTGAQLNEVCERSLADKTPTKNDRGELVFKDDNQKRLWKKNGHLYKQVIQQKEMRDMAKQIGATMKVKEA